MNKTKLLTLSAVFCALIAVLTAYSGMLFPVANGGYMHVGDSLVFLVGCLLPFPYSVLSAAVGGLLADLLVGAGAYAPFTFVIKGLMALVFCLRRRDEKLLKPKTFLLALLASAVNWVGYVLAEWLLFGWAAAVAVAVSPPLQTVFSYGVFVLLVLIVGKRNLFRW